MRTRITIRLDADLLSEARILAGEMGLSMSGLVALLLGKALGRRRTFDEARARAKARLVMGFDLGWMPAKSRDEIYERSV